MNEEEQFPQPPPSGGDATFRKIMWLCAALCPSAIGFACVHIKNPGQLLFPCLVVVDVICSVAGSLGLVRGMKTAASRAFLGLFLSVFFFVLNAVIVLFMGCSGIGGIGH
jgi:uncharacterized membrane protein YphA (DoxX/SURF4 family)